ncbi:NAD(P)/FAD-dependent oxidoreductase [Streptomyces sp. RTd22]|uniref:NAD(P)/FAD-dependent oxidoreductase n=1 Tax=Streptomyces sp. RTd22 TaxID=1841249 RepID=UPI000A8C8795|nr:FAD-binding oxidoreductase [Streptomyces sp. RTd22]
MLEPQVVVDVLMARRCVVGRLPADHRRGGGHAAVAQLRPDGRQVNGVVEQAEQRVLSGCPQLVPLGGVMLQFEGDQAAQVLKERTVLDGAPPRVRQQRHVAGAGDGDLRFNDLRNLRIYAHPTTDGRLVFGGRGAPYHFRSKVSPRFDTDVKIHARIAGTMRAFFPALADVEITHRWGGPLGVPRDWFPSVGYHNGTGMAWAGPYVGDGVATSNLAGRILRNLITGRRDELNRLPIVNHASPRWEIEPFRWLGVNAGLRAAATADVEERLTKRPSAISALLEKLTGAH